MQPKLLQRVAPDGTYRPVFFFCVSVAVVEAPRLGTGIERGGKEMLVRSPATLEEIVSFATHTVLDGVIEAAEPAILKNTSTFDAVVLASLAMMEMLSTTAPSLPRQSTSKTQPPPLGVSKLVAVVSADAPPIVANECSGRSTSSGILLELLVAKVSLPLYRF